MKKNLVVSALVVACIGTMYVPANVLAGNTYSDLENNNIVSKRELENESELFECTSLYKLSFDFDGYICINDLSITDNDNRIVICVNDGDFYVECDNYTCKARPIGGYEEQNRKLDEFFKRNW